MPAQLPLPLWFGSYRFSVYWRVQAALLAAIFVLIWFQIFPHWLSRDGSRHYASALWLIAFLAAGLWRLPRLDGERAYVHTTIYAMTLITWIGWLALVGLEYFELLARGPAGQAAREPFLAICVAVSALLLWRKAFLLWVHRMIELIDFNDMR